MKEELKEIPNQELMAIYRLLLEQVEYIENEKQKMTEADSDEK